MEASERAPSPVSMPLNRSLETAVFQPLPRQFHPGPWLANGYVWSRTVPCRARATRPLDCVRPVVGGFNGGTCYVNQRSVSVCACVNVCARSSGLRSSMDGPRFGTAILVLFASLHPSSSLVPQHGTHPTDRYPRPKAGRHGSGRTYGLTAKSQLNQSRLVNALYRCRATHR